MEDEAGHNAQEEKRNTEPYKNEHYSKKELLKVNYFLAIVFF